MQKNLFELLALTNGGDAKTYGVSVCAIAHARATWWNFHYFGLVTIKFFHRFLVSFQIVNLIKTSPENPTTAAIGDGANDVSMIQEAHVGLGRNWLSIEIVFPLMWNGNDVDY